MLLLSACEYSRYIGDSEYLIRKNPIVKGNDELSSEEVLTATKTRANRKALIFKPYLMAYNAGMSIKEDSDFVLKKLYNSRYPNGALLENINTLLISTIGEKPEVIDSYKIQKDVRNLNNYYFSKGYFNANVDYEIIYNPKKKSFAQQADVVFHVNENEAYIIDSVHYDIRDPYLLRFIKSIEDKSLLKKGKNYNENDFSAERDRITAEMKNKGLFRFSVDKIVYIIDTLNNSPSELALKDTIRKKTPLKYFDVTLQVQEHFKIYTINKIQINITKNDPGSAMNIIQLPERAISEEIRKKYQITRNLLNDTLDINFSVQENQLRQVNFNFLSQLIYLKKNDDFDLNNLKRTQKRIQDLNIFRSNFIRLEADDSLKKVNVNMDLQLARENQLKIGAETFTTDNRTLNSQYPGVGGNLTYSNINLLRHGERLDITARGNVSFYASNESKSVINLFYEYGLRANYSLPKFGYPWKVKANVSDFNPRTDFTFDLASENRREFYRLLLNMKYGITWYHIPFSSRSSSTIVPISLSLVNTNTTPYFDESLADLPDDTKAFIMRDFQPRFNSAIAYSWTYSDFGTSRLHPTGFFKGMAEFGGTIPYLLDQFLGNDSSRDDGYIQNRIFYGQYVKFSIEGKEFYPFGMKSELIVRGRFGVGFPLFGSEIMPFETRFYTGGTVSLRGWQSNTLGPGYFSQSASTVITPGGDFLFDSNIEYRRNITDMIEIAAFSDLGNVWYVNKKSFTDPSGWFSFKDLQVGWNLGLGLRFDFTFLVMRLDLGQQVYAPDIRDFVIKRFPKDIGGNRLQYNLGIGYPF